MQFPKHFLLNDEPESVIDGDTRQTANPSGENGSFQFTTIEEAITANEKLKGILEKERLEKREWMNQARAAKGQLQSIDPEEYAQLKAEKEAAEQREQERVQKELEDKKQYEELVRLEKERAARERAELQGKLKEKEQLLLSIETERTQTKIKDAVLSAWSKPAVNGNPELFDIAHTALTSQGVFQYNAETKTVEVINTRTGDVLLDDLGSPLTVEGYLVSNLKTEKPSLFLSQKKQGIGTTPPTNGTTTRSSVSWDELKNLSPAQMARLGNKKK
jgi:hypothetical protein